MELVEVEVLVVLECREPLQLVVMVELEFNFPQRLEIHSHP
jgi:hypothetical protein